MAKSKFEINDVVDCPYCGRRGTIVNRWGGGDHPISYHVIHKWAWVDLPGKMGGTIKAEVVLESCWKGVKRINPDFIEEEPF